MSIPPASLQPQHIEQIYTGIYNEMNKQIEMTEKWHCLKKLQ